MIGWIFTPHPQRQLVEELRDFQFKVTAAGSYTAEARSGAHDDLITCLGLATLLDGSAGPHYRGPSLNVEPGMPRGR